MMAMMIIVITPLTIVMCIRLQEHEVCFQEKGPADFNREVT